MKAVQSIVILFLCLVLSTSCNKVDSFNKSKTSEDLALKDENRSLYTRGGVYSQTNFNLLKLVLSGVGGYIQVDSNCVEYQVDSLCRVSFPQYTPPINENGILTFSTSSDLQSFIKASTLMEDLWTYSEVDFEDSPLEIYHLGEESLNAFDSAMNFKSLRGIYEFNEFNDDNWGDTAIINVEDDDLQIVLNELNEVKVGSKYYKYVASNIIAEINNNQSTLDSIRRYGLFMPGNSVRFYNELNGSTIKPIWEEIIGKNQSCPDFHLVVTSYFSKFISPTVTKWVARVEIDDPISWRHPNRYKDVKANYIIDWGDGSTNSFVGYLTEINDFPHEYTHPPSGYITRQISVRCQLIQQQNPSEGYINLLNNCPDLPSIVFNSTTTIKIDTYNYPDCLKGRIVRSFYGQIINVNGTNYKIECKLKQVTDGASFILSVQRPKIGATLVFKKEKNGKWKKSKSIGNIKIALRGNIYNSYDCNDLFYTISESKSKKKRKKIKVTILGKVGTEIFFPDDFRTQRLLPNAINADYTWNYNNGQITIGNYNELLKP